MTNQNVGGKREGRGRKHARFLLAGNCMVGTPGTETGNTGGAECGERRVCSFGHCWPLGVKMSWRQLEILSHERQLLIWKLSSCG